MTGITVTQNSATVTVTTVENGVELQQVSPAFVVEVQAQGPQGPAGNGFNFYLEHQQASAQSTWLIAHNFGRKPSVSVVDSGGNEVFANIMHQDIYVVQIDFSVPVAGIAILTA